MRSSCFCYSFFWIDLFFVKYIFYLNAKIKIMIKFGIIFILLALISYTVAVWTERITKKIKFWIVLTFGFGLLCDFVGTSIMFYISEHRFSFSFHSVCGYLALVIMLLHLIWAVLSIKKIGKCEQYFTRFSIFAWIIWLVAFISGIPH